MRRDSRLMKFIAFKVLISFILLVLQPPAMAIQAPIEKPTTLLGADTIVMPMQRPDALHNLSHQLRALQTLSFNLRSGFQPIDVTPMRDTVAAYHAQGEAAFNDMTEVLDTQNLPAVIVQRHQQAMQHYAAEHQTLLAHFDAITNATSFNQQHQAIESSITHLDRLLNNHRHSPLNPKQLPFGQPRPSNRLPREATEQTLRSGAAKTLQTQLRAAPGPEHLVATPEAQITAEIQALAASLKHNPVAIYNWVRNNIHFIPTYGAVQGSQLTLDRRAGNAYDTASLLIALLRASGIHARYTYGTVRIPIEKVKNWVGGIADPEAAVQMLYLGGVPVTSLTQAGVIKYVKMEHIWVDAWIDFLPSRGAEHRQGDSWVPLDASFKQYSFSSGLDLASEIPFPGEQVAANLLPHLQYDAAAGWTGFSQPELIEQAISEYNDALLAHLDTQHTTLDASAFLNGQSIIVQNRPVLTHSLPYQLMATHDTYAQLPAALRHTITIELFNTANAQVLNNPTLSYTLSLPELSALRLGLTYVPATEADAQALTHFRDEVEADTFPAYLIKVKPVLMLEDTPLATGTAITLGQSQYYTVTLQNPQYQDPHQGILTAGDEVVFGVNSNGIDLSQIEKRQASIDPSGSTAENLQQLALHFWAEHDLFDAMIAQGYGVHRQRMPSFGLFSSPITVNYFMGVPRAAIYKSWQIDVKQNLQIALADTDAQRFEYMSQIGMQGSYLESSVIEQLFDYEDGHGVSTTLLLNEAMAQGIPIYTVTAENIAQVLPQLAVSSVVKSDISAAIATGQQVIIPQREIAHGEWIGSGYVVQDPLTGAGAYLIEGGLNGGTLECLECLYSKYPVLASVIPLVTIHALMLMAAVPIIARVGPTLLSNLASLANVLLSRLAILMGAAVRAVARNARYTRNAKGKKKKRKRKKSCQSKLQLYQLSFINDLESQESMPIYKDGGTNKPPFKALTGAEWVDKNLDGRPDEGITESQFFGLQKVRMGNPSAYVRNSKVLVKAVFKASPALTTEQKQSLKIEGEMFSDGEGADFTDKFVTSKFTFSGNLISAEFQLDTKALLPNSVQYFNPMEIEWFTNVKNQKKGKQPSKNSDLAIFDAGSSKNRVYVTLAKPKLKKGDLLLTYLHLATAKPGAKTPSQAVDNTWEHFSDLTLKTWDNKAIVYYPSYRKEATDTVDEHFRCKKSAQTFTKHLWSYHYHEKTKTYATKCGDLVDLFGYALLVNNISSNLILVSPHPSLNQEFMLVKNWRFKLPSLNEQNGFNWVLHIRHHVTPPYEFDEFNWNYQDFENLPGIAGQNNPTPSLKIFDNHAIIKVDLSNSVIHYDPSYGIFYQGANFAEEFTQAAVAGYGYEISKPIPKDNYLIREFHLKPVSQGFLLYADDDGEFGTFP